MFDQPCTVDANQLLHHLDSAAEPEFRVHLVGCLECQVRLLQMVAAATRDATRSDCADARAHLAEFVAAGPEQDSEIQPFMALQEHLVLCNECFALYKEVRFMAQLVLDDTLPTPPHRAYRAPNLAFLQPAFEWINIQTKGTKLIRSLRLHLSALFQPVQLAPSMVRNAEPHIETDVAHRPAVEPVVPSEELVLGVETLGELDVDVKLYPEAGSAALARLEVRALAIERFAIGFGGTRVVLHLAGKVALQRETNEEGVAIFEQLPRNELSAAVLEITPAG